MTIAIEASAAVRQLGGISEYSRQILRALGEIDQTNHYEIVSFGHSSRGRISLPPLPKNFHYRHIALPYKLLQASWRVFSRPKINRWLPRADIFFAPHFLLPVGDFKKVVIVVHDVLFLDHPEWFLPQDARHHSAELKLAVRRADHILTDSQASKESLLRHGLGTDQTITVIPLGVTMERALPSDVTRVRDCYGLPAEYLFYLGTIEPRKNILRLIDAYAILVKDGLDLPLVLAGRRGWLGQELERKLSSLGLVNHVRLLGSIPDQDRQALLTGARVFTYLPLAEGFGLPPLEAMAVGTPVVTSNSSSLPEVVGDAALTVDPYDTQAIALAIRKLLEDTELRGVLRTKGLQRAQEFTWQRTAQATLAVFEQVVQ